jgi:Uma2 family endonuclease
MRRSDVATHVEARMPAEQIEYRPMSLEDYLGLPDDVRAEYVDGTAILTTPGTWKHNNLAARFAALLDAALRGVFVATQGGVRTAARKYRYGDVAVVPVDQIPEGRFSDSPPVLVVEVLSSSTRREDLVRKSHEYLTCGVGQYWLVDRDERSLAVYSNTDDGWELMLELSAEKPRGAVVVGQHGTVDIDLDALLAH